MDNIIATQRVTSPPGTFAIPALTIEGIESKAVRQALLYRIARYVSPEPWGGPSAELGRRKDSMDRLIKHMSHSLTVFRKKGDNSLCVGSRVWWRLAFLTKVTFRTTVQAARPQDLVWLAMRQPERRAGGPEGMPHPLRVNVTPWVMEARGAFLSGNGPSTLEILFERRFVVRFFLDKIPQEMLDYIKKGDKILIKHHQVWMLPQVAHIKSKKSHPIHTVIPPDGPSKGHEWGIKASKMHTTNWIGIECARPLSAI